MHKHIAPIKPCSVDEVVSLGKILGEVLVDGITSRKTQINFILQEREADGFVKSSRQAAQEEGTTKNDNQALGRTNTCILQFKLKPHKESQYSEVQYYNQWINSF